MTTGKTQNAGVTTDSALTSGWKAGDEFIYKGMCGGRVIRLCKTRPERHEIRWHGDWRTWAFNLSGPDFKKPSNRVIDGTHTLIKA